MARAWLGFSPNASLEQGDGPITQEQLARLLGGVPSSSGVAVTEASAMRVSTVYACVSLLAGAFASLPLKVYARNSDAREEADHPYNWLLGEEPYPDFSAAVFWEYLLTSYLLHGDCYAIILRASPRLSTAIGFEPVHPSNVQTIDTATGRVFRIRSSSGTVKDRIVSAADMIHVPGVGYDGVNGLSIIRAAARNAIGTAISAEEYSGSFFRNGARPDYALQTDHDLTPEQVGVLRETLAQRHQGAANAHTPIVLSGGLKIEKLTMPSDDAKLIETRGFQVEDICRAFGVPPFMVGHMDKTSSWGSGVEAMGRGFLRFTLLRHLTKFQQELNRKLWPLREKYFVEFVTAGLERADTASRFTAYRQALGRAGEPAFMTPNEVRRLENLPPVEGGDELFRAEAPAEPDPNAAPPEDPAAQALREAAAALQAHVAAPPPAIHVQMPEQRRRVVERQVVRDEDGMITHVKETENYV